MHGKKHTVTISNAPSSGTLLVRLGEGNNIQDVSDRLFAVDDQHFYIQVDAGTNKPFLRTIGDKKELVVAIKGSAPSQITYSLLW